MNPENYPACKELKRNLFFVTGFPLVSLDLTNFIFVGDEAMEHIGKITRYVSTTAYNIICEHCLQL